MNKNVRIAFQLRHKDDSNNKGIGDLSYSDFQWNKRRYLYHSNGSNEYVLFKDSITDSIHQMIGDIIVRGKDKEILNDPCLVYLYQFDDNGNSYYSDQVNQKWKDWMKVNHERTKPHQLYTYVNGLEVGCTPILHEKCVFTTVRFTGDTSDYADIGKLSEALINQFINIENNLTLRVIKLYDHCMKIAHDLHLLDTNQDAKLVQIWDRMTDVMGQVDEVANWIPTIDYYKSPPKRYEINLSTSDPAYMYKYKLTNGDKSDKTPMFETSIACESAGRPIPFAELTHTKDGNLLSAFFSYGAETEYTRRDLIDGAWSASINASFSRNPSVPVYYDSAKLGDSDNQVSNVSGSVTVNHRGDVPDAAYHEMPWMEVYFECYNFGGALVKTISGKWDINGSTRLVLSNRSMLAGTYSFKGALSGYYAVKTRLRVFWGTFGSWTDEVKLCYFSLARGNNSGGTWRINDYIFNGQSNRILTRCQLHGASKYEKNVIINGRGYGWGGNINPPITWNSNGTFGAPGSADHWDASFYGKIYAKPGCNFICKDFHNVGVSGTRDVSSSVHYPDAANYSILTVANLHVSYSGRKAKYSQDWYNTPSLYAPVANDCTVMMRGGSKYQLISYCQNLVPSQIGVMKVDVGTIGVTYKNTKYYGRELYMSQDFIITGRKSGRSYKLDTIGNPPTIKRIVSGVPSPDTSKIVRQRSLMSVYPNDPVLIKPEPETGMGYITKLMLYPRDILEEFSNKWLTIYCSDNTEISFKIGYISNEEWTSLYNNDKQRVYGIVRESVLYVMTYYIDTTKIVINHQSGNTMEFILRDYETNEITHSFSLLPYKPENGIPVKVGNDTYYLELSLNDDEIDSESADPVVFRDAHDKLIGYLK